MEVLLIEIFGAHCASCYLSEYFSNWGFHYKLCPVFPKTMANYRLTLSQVSNCSLALLLITHTSWFVIINLANHKIHVFFFLNEWNKDNNSKPFLIDSSALCWQYFLFICYVQIKTLGNPREEWVAEPILTPSFLTLSMHTYVRIIPGPWFAVGEFHQTH